MQHRDRIRLLVPHELACLDPLDVPQQGRLERDDRADVVSGPADPESRRTTQRVSHDPDAAAVDECVRPRPTLTRGLTKHVIDDEVQVVDTDLQPPAARVQTRLPIRTGVLLVQLPPVGRSIQVVCPSVSVVYRLWWV